MSDNSSLSMLTKTSGDEIIRKNEVAKLSEEFQPKIDVSKFRG